MNSNINANHFYPKTCFDLQEFLDSRNRQFLIIGLPEIHVLSGNYSMYKSPAMMSTNRPLNIATDSTNFSTPITSHATTKKKGSKDVSDCPVAAKRSRSCIQRNQQVNFFHGQQYIYIILRLCWFFSGDDLLGLVLAHNLVTQSSNRDKKGDESLTNSTTVLSTHDSVSKTSSLQGSNVVKCLFNQKTTPSQASPSHMEKSIYPSETCATSVSIKDHTPQTITSTNCTIISKATIRVSPTKQVGVAYYSIETNNQCLSTNSPRSNTKAKGWLDFHASDKPEIREKQTHNALELGFPNIEALGMELNFLLIWIMKGKNQVYHLHSKHRILRSVVM